MVFNAESQRTRSEHRGRTGVVGLWFLSFWFLSFYGVDGVVFFKQKAAKFAKVGVGWFF